MRLLVAATVVVLAGCCGNGTTHKCDFTPAPKPYDGGGSDAPVPCGTAVCDPPQVCCLKKSPLVALCIDVQNFIDDGCEKMDLPCLVPADCPFGLSCCVDRVHFLVSCRPSTLCPVTGDTQVSCATNDDCPAEVPSCDFLGASPDGTTLRVCE